MSNGNLKKLYVDELKDLYSAEKQLVKALPKMAKAASSEKLRQGFEGHLEQTKGHVQRLEKIFQSLNESPKGKKCVSAWRVWSRKDPRPWKKVLKTQYWTRLDWRSPTSGTL